MIETFEGERGRLVGLAYRITGSRAEADDIVQDTWLRWQAADQASIRSTAAWLTTVTSRIALDRLKAARHTREAYVGPWLPEVANPEPGPEDRAELAESLTLGFLAVLERLGPTERVVFLLADIFGLSFDEIARVVDKSPKACRQVASRARRRVRDQRPRFSPTDEAAWEVTVAFLTAAQLGDLDTLVSLLADGALATSDGGADHHAARRPIIAEKIPRFMANLASRLGPTDVLIPHLVNGQPGLVIERDGKAGIALSFSIDAGQVTNIWIVVNPAKIQTLDSAPIS